MLAALVRKVDETEPQRQPALGDGQQIGKDGCDGEGEDERDGPRGTAGKPSAARQPLPTTRMLSAAVLA